MSKTAANAFLCACGCGRTYGKSAGWDGYHGPDFTQPVGAPRRRWWHLRVAR